LRVFKKGLRRGKSQGGGGPTELKKNQKKVGHKRLAFFFGFRTQWGGKGGTQIGEKGPWGVSGLGLGLKAKGRPTSEPMALQHCFGKGERKKKKRFVAGSKPTQRRLLVGEEKRNKQDQGKKLGKNGIVMGGR